MNKIQIIGKLDLIATVDDNPATYRAKKLDAEMEMHNHVWKQIERHDTWMVYRNGDYFELIDHEGMCLYKIKPEHKLNFTQLSLFNEAK